MSLDASAYLLMAEGHLRKAEETLAKRGRRPKRILERILAHEATVNAVDNVRYALALLKQKKDEPCKP